MEHDDLIIDGELVLYGDVGDVPPFGFQAKTVLKALAELEDPLTVRINSVGGFVDEGVAIYQALKARGPVVHIDGMAASAASLIAMAGAEIVMSEGAVMMIHDPAGLTIGNADAHEKTADFLNRWSDVFAEIYAERTGNDVDQVREWMKAETFMTAAEAVERGFATRISEKTPEPVIARQGMKILASAPQWVRAAVRMASPDAAREWLISKEKPMPQAKKNGADATADAQTPTEDTTVATATDTKARKVTAKAAEPDKAPDVKAEIAEALRKERARVAAIRMAGTTLGAPEAEIDAAIEGDISANKFRAQVIKAFAERGQSATAGIGGPSATVTMDAREKFVEGAKKALMAKARLKDGERNEFSSMTLTEIARKSIEMAGERIGSGMSRLDIVGRAFTMAGAAHSTSDFGNILADVAHKSALAGWDASEETYPQWTRQGTISDFKPARRVGIGLISALPQVIEGAEYTYGTVGDRGETITLATYGKILRFTRQAVINDDLGMLSDVPMRMGTAARRTVGNLAYAVLTDNANMSDGNPLFDALHNNQAGTGAAPSVATLQAGKAGMATQKDAGHSLNIRPAFILAPVALEATISELLNSTVHPGSQKGHSFNPVQGMVDMITDARLDDVSTTAWYLAASPTAYDTVEVAFLDGQSMPFLEERDGWTMDGAEMKVRIDAAAKALDWRTMWYNVGV